MENTNDLLGELRALRQLMEQQNELISRQLAEERNWKRKLGNGVVTGLGGVIGATLVVSAFLYILKPFSNVDLFRPTVERVIDDLQHKGKG